LDAALPATLTGLFFTALALRPGRDVERGREEERVERAV
jgi:hypothetical protein